MSKRLTREDLDRLLELIAQDDGALPASVMDVTEPGTAAHRLAEANERYWAAEIDRVSGGGLAPDQIDRAAQFLNSVEFQQAVFGPIKQAAEDLALGDSAFGVRLVWVRSESQIPGEAGVSSDQFLLAGEVDAPPASDLAGIQMAMDPVPPPVSLSSVAAALDPKAHPHQLEGERDDTASSSGTGGRAGFNAAMACLFLQTSSPAARPYDGWEDFQARNGLTVDLVTDLKTAYPDGFAKLNFCVGLAAVASKRPAVAESVQTSLAEQQEMARQIYNFDGLALLRDVHGLDIDIRVELPELIARHGETLENLAAEVTPELPPAVILPTLPVEEPLPPGIAGELAITQTVVAAAAAMVPEDPLVAVPAAGPSPPSPPADLSAAVLQSGETAVGGPEMIVLSASAADASPVVAAADMPVPPGLASGAQAGGPAVDVIVTVGIPKGLPDTSDVGGAVNSGGGDPSPGSGHMAYDDPVAKVSDIGELLLDGGQVTGPMSSAPHGGVNLRASIGAEDPVPLKPEAASDVRVIEEEPSVPEAEFSGADQDDDDCDSDQWLGETGADYVMFALGSDTLVLQPEFLEPYDDGSEPEFWPNEQGPVIPDQIAAYGFKDDTFGADLWHALDVADGAVILDSDNLRLVSSDSNESGRGDLLCL